MKIQIIGTPRSGTTSLSRMIWHHIESIGYVKFLEPFNPRFYEYYKSSGYCFDSYEPLKQFNKLLIKNIFLSENKEYPEKQFNSNREHIEFTSTFFDKVIILDRKDRFSQTESFVVNETAERLTGISWSTPKIYRTDNLDANFFNNIFGRLKESEIELYNFSQKYNYPLFYYEDIFTKHNINELERLFNYIGIEMRMDLVEDWVFNKKRRVRIDPLKIDKLI